MDIYPYSMGHIPMQYGTYMHTVWHMGHISKLYFISWWLVIRMLFLGDWWLGCLFPGDWWLAILFLGDWWLENLFLGDGYFGVVFPGRGYSVMSGEVCHLPCVHVLCLSPGIAKNVLCFVPCASRFVAPKRRHISYLFTQHFQKSRNFMSVRVCITG